MKIYKCINLFLVNRRENGVSNKTLLCYSQRLQRFNNDVIQLGVEYITDINNEIMKKWFDLLVSTNEIYQDNPHRKTEQKKLSPSTIRSYFRDCSIFLRWCEGENYIIKSPNFKPKINGLHRSKMMSMETLKKLIDHSDIRDRAIIYFIAETGARRGEVSSIKISDLNLDNNTAVVYGKTGIRCVNFGEMTNDCIKRWLSSRSKTSEYLFHTRDGSQISPEAISEIFKRLGKRSGAKPPYNPHSLRHLVGYVFSCENIELARKKLGHSSIDVTTKFYAHQDNRIQEKTEQLSIIKKLKTDNS